MKEQYIQLLNKQIEKLDKENFDLEAWKTSAISVIQRIFGDSDTRANQLEQLKIDYSSWMLRDSNSKYKPIETAKLKGKEILNTAIEEIEIFGMQTNENQSTEIVTKLQGMTEKELIKYLKGLKKSDLVEVVQDLIKN